MSLARWIRERNWAELENAWTDLALKEGGVTEALAAIDVAATRKELPRILSYVRDHADVLVEGGRPRDAAKILGACMLAGGSPGELSKALYSAAEAGWGEEPFWEGFCQISGLTESAPDMRKAWKAFSKLTAIQDGRIVYHAQGWGLGRMESLDFDELEAKVRFLSGRSDRFPFASCVDIFEMLDENDLRCLVVTDPDRLKKMLKDEPLEVLRWVVKKGSGKINHASIKLTLKTLGVDGARFTTFWRKAQKLAEQSEWFELSGPAQRPVVRLLDTAEDPGEALKRQLLRSRDLSSALTRVRSALSGEDVPESVRTTALEALDHLVSDETQHLPQRVVTWIYLREARGETPEELRATIEEARNAPPPASPNKAPALWNLFASVPTLRDQERFIELFRETAPDTWLEEAAAHLQHAPLGMVRGLVDAMLEAKRQEDLLNHYSALLARPTRNPGLLVHLAEKLEKGAAAERLLPPAQRAQCLLQLAVHLQRATGSQPDLVRARTRLSSLLTAGKPPLLRRLLDGAGVDQVRGLASMIEAGVERAVDRLFTQIAIEISPNVFRGDERPFWEGPGLWTTRPALKKREEELRVLRDVKIPENSEAIGKAASFGDLSENSEWEAAIEEQRHLTQKAMDLEEAIRTAQLIENAAIPPETVAPGTRVRYTELDGDEAGSAHEIEILGPWDADGQHRVSYRSPLAKGMLGLHPGDEAHLELPSGTRHVRVDGIEVMPL